MIVDWLLSSHFIYMAFLQLCHTFVNLKACYTLPRSNVSLFLAGLSAVEEVATGVEHILADMIAKDPETLTYVKTL